VERSEVGSEHLVVAIEAGVGRITVAREDKRNALSEALRDELVDAMNAFAADDAVRVVLLTGGTKVFSAGFDLEEVAATKFATFAYRVEEYNEALYGFPKPIVAAIAGPALAGGFDLALCADVIVAADTAVFGHPEVEFGAVPSVALLEPRVGTGRARELALTGRRIDAAEALRIGVADRVVPQDDLDREATALAESLARRTMATLQGVRAAGWAHLHTQSALRREFELSIGAVLDPENVARLEAYLLHLGSR
jgi:enoyl-CoA hydratase/carnithine racemase